MSRPCDFLLPILNLPVPKETQGAPTNDQTKHGFVKRVRLSSKAAIAGVEVITDSSADSEAAKEVITDPDPAPRPDRNPSASACEPYRDLIEKAVGLGRNATVIWQDLVDDLGMRKLPPTAAEDLLEIIMRRYERASTILTSNRPIEDWGKVLGDNAAVTAMLDRLLHHAHVLKTGPRSWRTREKEPLRAKDAAR